MAAKGEVIFTHQQCWSLCSTQAKQMRSRGGRQAQVSRANIDFLNSCMKNFQLMLLRGLGSKFRAALQGVALSNNNTGL